MKHQAPQLFELNPKTVVAFQWLPDNEDFVYPKWFVDMVETGRAYTVKNPKQAHVSLSNKRGDYRGLPGDWICKDEYGHIFVVSQKTFHDRYQPHKKGK